MPQVNRDVRTRSQHPSGAAAAGGNIVPPPPPYNPAASRGRRSREADASSGTRGSDASNRRREPSENSTSSRRGNPSGGSSRDVSNTVNHRRGSHTASSSSHASERLPAIVTNQDGDRVDTNRHGGRAAGPRVVHRVGMECLSPINIGKDAPSTGGEKIRVSLKYARKHSTPRQTSLPNQEFCY